MNNESRLKQLNELIATAQKLGFWDDVLHFEQEKRSILRAMEARA